MNTHFIHNNTLRLLLLAGLLGLLAACGGHGDHADDRDGYAHDDGHAHVDEDSHEEEGHTVIPAEMAAAMGVRTALVEPGTIADELALYGRIEPNAERLRAVAARFPGVVQEVSVQVGTAVRAGQVLATVESNESLRSYTVTAPIGGIVTRRAVNPGETTGGEALFEVASFDSVWAELSVFPRDRGRLRVGQAVVVQAADGEARGSGRIAFISPVGVANQSLVARVVLANADGQWTPGQFVNARVAVAQSDPLLVVPLSALQTWEGRDVVAINEGDEYRLQPVRLGRRDGTQVEVLEGIEPGTRIVVANSYLVKADVEKSGAAHEH